MIPFLQPLLGEKPGINVAAELDQSLLADRESCSGRSRDSRRKIRSDNGPETFDRAITAWAEVHEVEPPQIKPGKATQNAYIKRFNRTFRQEVLDRVRRVT